MKFIDLGISEPILRAVEDEGYESPTPIQEKTIQPALAGRDVLGLAQTGTGKTAAFAIPTLQRLSGELNPGRNRKIRALVLTPTRELATQVYESFESYGHYLPLRSTVIFGGTSQGKQVSALRNGIDVLVATPGRLIDLINQGYIDLKFIEVFILDEADRMLDMGFIHDIRRISKMLPKKKQTLLFSATMPKEIEEIVENLLEDPIQVSVAPVSSTVDTVTQYVQYVDQNHKIDLFVDFLKETNGQPVLVFTRTKRGADRVVRDLKKKGVDAAAIHGNKSQNARQRALDDFKEYETQVLVATDIASRGIDINELAYVVNYDMPEVPETYVHRIGRTGRAGHSGQSLSLVNFRDIPLLKEIEKLIRQKITVLENPKYPLVDKTEKPKKPNKKAKKREAERKANQQESKSEEKRNHRKQNRHHKKRKPRDGGKPREERKPREDRKPQGERKQSKRNNKQKQTGKPSKQSGGRNQKRRDNHGSKVKN